MRRKTLYEIEQQAQKVFGRNLFGVTTRSLSVLTLEISDVLTLTVRDVGITAIDVHEGVKGPLVQLLFQLCDQSRLLDTWIRDAQP